MRVPLLNDRQLAEVEQNPEFKNRGDECPICFGLNKYFYRGVEYECPDDEYGHPMLRLAKFYWLHNIPIQFQWLIWDEFPHASEKEDIERYLEYFKRLRMSGVGISVFGETLGVGKTWAVTHVLKECVKLGYDGWFVTAFDLMGNFEIADKARADYLMKRMKESEILVIDDILKPWGRPTQRDFYEQELENIVRSRTNMNFPTLITTNMRQDDFNVTYPRISSLLSAKNLEFHFQGIDARKHGLVWENNEKLAFKGETRPIT